MNSTHSTAPSPTNSSDQFYGLLTILLSVLIIATIFFVAQYSKSRTQASVEEIIGSNLNSEFTVANSFKTVGGKILEVGEASSASTIKLAVADEPASSLSTDAGSKLIEILLAFQQASSLNTKMMPDFLVRYGAAQYDRRRVSNFETKELHIGSKSIVAHTFLTSKKDFYIAAVFQSKLGPTLYLASRKESPVPEATLAKFLEPLL